VSLFFKPFHQIPQGVPGSVKRNLVEDARHQIANRVVPAYRRFLEFFEAEYLPAGPEEIGVSRLPDGRELYRFFARKFTTTDLSPEEIHETGLREVARIRDEMGRVIQALNFRGTFDDFLAELRDSPRFYITDADQLLEAYRATCARIDSQLPRLFRRLPRIWYDIRPVPANLAPDTTTAYYRPLSADGKRPGTYFVNLYHPEVRPTYEIEALSLHEAVPGHHLQIALAMEIDDLPDFRRYAPEGDYTGYVEGWALYAESLGGELGCYRDPYSQFGRLTYEMWRAVRLVVDTGIHAFGWSRDRAVTYFRDHAAKALHDIENEVDRYIAWPGQALAYKIGELEIKRLRAQAEVSLGASFDLQKFHEVLLNDGALPLDMLAAQVRRWLEAGARTDSVRP
jgi:prolyl oligopeptidase